MEGEIINHAPSACIIIDEEDELMYDELEQRDLDQQQFVNQQADVESIKILTLEINDPIFNGESDTYTNADAARVSSILEAAINCTGDFDIPSNFSFCPDTMNEFDVNVDAVAFVCAVSKYEADCVHKISVGSVASHTSIHVSESSPFVEVVADDKEAGSDLHSALISTAAKRSRGVSSEHLSKVWRIDKDIAERTISVLLS
jgi:hypothetical protein